MRQKGFTLVELAIVLMIIGLLIGGILKGQELINNARITSFIRQLKNYDAAVITFQDSYGALPGDITSPSTRLPDCSTSPCNTAGNGNGIIGLLNDSTDTENDTMIVHLSKANLISGSTDALAYGATRAVGLDGVLTVVNFVVAPDSTFPEGKSGHYWEWMVVNSVPTAVRAIPATTMDRLDRKMDDGIPRRGIMTLVGDCSTSIAIGAANYTVTNGSLCDGSNIKVGF